MLAQDYFSFSAKIWIPDSAHRFISEGYHILYGSVLTVLDVGTIAVGEQARKFHYH